MEHGRDFTGGMANRLNHTCSISSARQGFRPLPVPVKGGTIGELNSFLNLATRWDFVLIVSWLLAVLRPAGPYAVLIINGEQGAGKTLACRVLRRLIDPNSAELRTDTRNERDLLLAAKNGWIVALDNDRTYATIFLMRSVGSRAKENSPPARFTQMTRNFCWKLPASIA